MEIVVARAERALDYEAPVAPDDAASPPEGIIVADAAMRKLYDVLSRVSFTSATVLILGETGVGKEIVAEQIAPAEPRGTAPFLRLNCASVPEALLESELFGHERGAFTGAARPARGLLRGGERRHLLLDELGEMPLSVQAKLLRVLEDRRFSGSARTDEVRLDVRVLARHQPRPRARGRGRKLPRRSLLPHRHLHAAGPPAARAGDRDRRCSPSACSPTLRPRAAGQRRPPLGRDA